MTEALFHSGSSALIELWSALPGAARIPDRAGLDPARLGRLLPRLFMAERRDEGVIFRLAGGWIEKAHGRSLKDAYLLEVWRRDSRLMVHRGIAQAFREGRPMVFTAGMMLDELSGPPAEVVVAPMRGPSGAPDRLLGLYQPLSADGEEIAGVRGLDARSLTAAPTPPRRAPLTLAAIDGRRIA